MVQLGESKQMADLFYWPRSRGIYALVAISLGLLYLSYTSLYRTSLDGPDGFSHSRDFATAPVATTIATKFRAPNAEPEAVHLTGVKSPFAFATFLAGTDKEIPYDIDHYLIATRILTYQLLHAPETRSADPNIPFIIVVTELVKERTRERLRKDGAIVIEVPGLSADWLSPGSSTWKHVMTKMRLWELVDFERIAFIDADTVLVKPIDGIFTDPASAEQKTDSKLISQQTGLAPMPETYVFAGNAENTRDHHFPPTTDHRDWPNIDYLNAGFFVLKPDIALLKHYISVLNVPESFASSMPEQNLMNEVHRRDGNMPWRQLNTTLNVHYPMWQDVEKGAMSVHEKWWSSEANTTLRLFMQGWRWRMEGYFEARDEPASAS